MSEPDVRTAERIELLTAETSEGAQELQRRDATAADELGREVGAVLRLDGSRLDPDLDRLRAPRRRDDDHQHGAVAPVDPRGACA